MNNTHVELVPPNPSIDPNYEQPRNLTNFFAGKLLGLRKKPGEWVLSGITTAAVKGSKTVELPPICDASPRPGPRALTESSRKFYGFRK